MDKVQASHSMGADLTYKCLGGNSYEIELSFYRDCAGIEADSIANIFFQSSCYPSSSIQISLIPGTGQEISPACPNNTTTCNGGTFTGIQEYIYRGIINLPFQTSLFLLHVVVSNFVTIMVHTILMATLSCIL